VSNFEVIASDVNGQPVRCSYCKQGAKHVVVLPLTARPGLEDRLVGSDGDQLWIGLCAQCVLEMAEVLAIARGRLLA